MQFQALMHEIRDAVVAYDGRRLAELFTEDGYYLEPLHGLFRGQAEVKRLVEEVFKSTIDRIRWEIVDPICDGDIGYARWIFSFASKRPGLEGKRVALVGMSHVELADGRIKAYREVYDVGMAFAQLGLPPAASSDFYKKKVEAMVAEPSVATHLEH